MATYFIQTQDDQRYIKIGSSANPDKRLKQIQGMSPTPLVMLNVIDTNEFDLHQYFQHLNVYGEWFRPEKELLDFIANPTEVPKAESGILKIIRCPETTFLNRLDSIVLELSPDDRQKVFDYALSLATGKGL